MYTSIAQSVFFPLHERLKGHSSVAVRKALEKTQWYTPERLRDYQLQRLKAFLQDVGTHVPYYKELFLTHNFNPQAMENIAELSRLPCLNKTLIRKHTDELKAVDARALSRFNTGGSSGEPLIFYIGKERVSHDVAAKWRATRWWDVDIGDREIVVWGSPIELGAQDRIRLWRDKILRTRLLPAFEMSAEHLDQFVEDIRQYRPRMLFGYPSSLAVIAQHAEDNKVSMDQLGIRVVFVTSERLYDAQRETIERVFSCPVANGYGGRDAGFIAHQCPDNSMHITAEDIIVEVVDSDGQPVPHGQSGEITVTHMATRDFPFIRYRTGDIGVLSDEICACGRGLPVLKEIQGRTTDFIVAKNGTIMHGLALIYVLRDLPGVSEFKIIQESLDHLRVLVVRNDAFNHSDEQKIKDEYKKRLGETVHISVEYLTHIPRENSGKFRYVVSHVDSNQQGSQAS